MRNKAYQIQVFDLDLEDWVPALEDFDAVTFLYATDAQDALRNFDRKFGGITRIAEVEYDPGTPDHPGTF